MFLSSFPLGVGEGLLLLLVLPELYPRDGTKPRLHTELCDTLEAEELRESGCRGD